mmetsp:Transcript_35975/g.87930  ORF Transcript_35975/g.87930 Transcript_35975/m.87930 type:complete len:160 (-) Transcript_35975:63-542(-)
MDSTAFALSIGGPAMGEARASSFTPRRPAQWRSAGQRAHLRARTPAPRMAVKTVEEKDFDAEVLKSDVPVLVDFYAVWCGPCKLVAPLMDLVANEYDGKLKVVKVDTEKAPSFVKKYKIQGLPTLTVFKDGEVLKDNEGAIGKSELMAMLTTTLPELKE